MIWTAWEAPGRQGAAPRPFGSRRVVSQPDKSLDFPGLSKWLSGASQEPAGPLGPLVPPGLSKWLSGASQEPAESPGLTNLGCSLPGQLARRTESL